MRNNALTRSPLAVWSWSRLGWAVPAALGVLWFLLDADAGRYALPAAAVASIAGFLFQQRRARARRRRDALDAYAEREIARTKRPHGMVFGQKAVAQGGAHLRARPESQESIKMLRLVPMAEPSSVQNWR